MLLRIKNNCFWIVGKCTLERKKVIIDELLKLGLKEGGVKNYVK